uniref:Uncharacterized protein n=1 Tax=Brassica oleracea var. oleracea TaxID=109376 RepID=A0A0D3A8D7_BRAOL
MNLELVVDLVACIKSDTCRQGNGGRVFVRAKSNWDRDRHFSSLSFSLAAIERAILLSTAHLLRDGSPVDESPPKSSPLDGSPPEASLGGSHHGSLGASPSLLILSAVLLADLSTVLSVIRRLLGEVRFDHQDCISKEIKEKQPFPPQLKDERAARTQYVVPGFEESEEERFSVNMPSPLGNTMDRRTNVRNRQAHHNLKNDLIENI